MLAILVFEDIVVALMLGYAAAGGGEVVGDARPRREGARLHHRRPRGVALAHAPPRPAARPAAARVLPARGVRLPRRHGGDRRGARPVRGDRRADRGIVLSETSVREQIEDRFFSFRDIFAALFFFVFGLSIDVSAIGDVGWLVAFAVALTLVGKIGGGMVAGRFGGFTQRQSFNAGIALVAHGEFTIILAPARVRERRARPRRPHRPGRVRRALRPRDRDDRHRAHEGVEAPRPRSLPGP